jgi:hypothetical protein
MELAAPPLLPMGRPRSRCVTFAVWRELADFAPVGQSAFCQGWQLCVKNAVSIGWIITI